MRVALIRHQSALFAAGLLLVAIIGTVLITPHWPLLVIGAVLGAMAALLSRVR